HESVLAGHACAGTEVRKPARAVPDGDRSIVRRDPRERQTAAQTLDAELSDRPVSAASFDFRDLRATGHSKIPRGCHENHLGPALEPANLKVAFVTHFHSDPTAGYRTRTVGWDPRKRPTAAQLWTLNFQTGR